MGAIKINGSTSGSTTITAPATGSDETIELSTALAAKAPSASPTFTGTVALPSTTTLDGSTLNLPGMVLIASESFSAVSSVNVNDCFSATYTNYAYTAHITNSTQAQIGLRLRVSGADNTTSGNYLWSSLNIRWVTSTALTGEHSSTTATSFPFCDADGNPTFVDGKIFSPFASRFTGFFKSEAYNQGGSANDGYFQTGSGSLVVTTSYTGFTLFAASGNMSGTIKVYGLRD